MVAKDPASYLLPPMRAHGVAIDFMAQLFQQARDAGALDPSTDPSASAWFEEYRDALFQARQPWLGSKQWYDALKAQLQDAVAAVEETNRVIGLSRLVEQVHALGQNTLAVMEQHKQNASGQNFDACPYIAWGLT